MFLAVILLEITNQALMALRKIYKKEYNYKKAGVIVGDIISECSKQLSLFDKKDHFKIKNLMNSVDYINQTMGRNKIRLAVQGFDNKLRLKQENLSFSYTTKFEDLLCVKI
jgi:hypothetical protein